MQQNKFLSINFKNIDTWVVLASLIYVILPILIFLGAFTRPYIFVIGLVILIFLIYRIMNFTGSTNCNKSDGNQINFGFTNADILNKKSLIYFAVTTLIFCVWIFFSGIGSFSFQNWDHWVRNPIYNDIINKSWPLYYNLGMQPEAVRELIGGEWVAFAYYFTYWLTPAAICKVFGFIGGGLASRLILYFYTLVGVIIVNYLLARLFKKLSYKITLLFMGFSGLDVVAYIITNHKLPALTAELEWSLLHYQLSGNTTQLFYVFNQSIPIWIIMLLLLNFSVPGIMAAVAALCFAYSPWATIGLVPIAIVGMIKSVMCDINAPSDCVSGADNDSGCIGNASSLVTTILKSCISIVNILVPIFLLVVYGLYYTASGGSEGGKGLYYFTTEATVSEYIFGFIIFVLTEFGLYYIVMGKKAFKYRYSIIVFVELLLFPLFYVVDFNFFIRGTIPALFILMVIAISFVFGLNPANMDAPTDATATVSCDDSSNNISSGSSTEIKKLNLRKRILAAFLIIGALNSVIAFTRSAIYTTQGGDYLQSDIVTFDDMSGANEYQVLTTNSQFFVHGFATKPFYLHISKLGQ